MFVAGRRRGLGIGLVTVGIVGVVALSGCSSAGSAPRTLPRLSTTPAAVTSTAPPTTKAAELAAVKAVVRRYYALLNAPTTVANANALAALMTPNCPCQRVATSTRQIAAKGEEYFGRTRLISITPSLDGADAADALVEYDYTAGGIRDLHGREITHSAGRRGVLMSLRFRRTNSGWLIADAVVLREGTPA